MALFYKKEYVNKAPREYRPQCLYCGKTLRPYYREVAKRKETADNGDTTTVYVLRFDGKYGGYRDGCFCGLRCGYNFALRSVGRREE